MWRRSPQAFEGIPCGSFHNEVVRDTRRLHQNKGVLILPGWSCKILVVSITGSLQHLGRYEAHKLFPSSRTATIRKEICGIRQQSRETLHEYCERFNKLCATCPHHQISEQLLIQFSMKWRSINGQDASSNKAPDLQYGKQYTTIWDQRSQPTLNVDNLRLENQLTELTTLVRQLVVGQH
ncbi:hypothetical protein CR513_18888, partial [Mucuna pruriens]